MTQALNAMILLLIYKHSLQVCTVLLRLSTSLCSTFKPKTWLFCHGAWLCQINILSKQSCLMSYNWSVYFLCRGLHITTFLKWHSLDSTYIKTFLRKSAMSWKLWCWWICIDKNRPVSYRHKCVSLISIDGSIGSAQIITNSDINQL